MSPKLLATLRAHPRAAALAAALVILASAPAVVAASLSLTSALAAPNPTGAPAVGVDVGVLVRAYDDEYDGAYIGTYAQATDPWNATLRFNGTYDVTFTNISYGPPGVSNASRLTGLTLVSSTGIVTSPRDAYPDGAHAGRYNVTFPAQNFTRTGAWDLVSNGSRVASVLVRPADELVVTLEPSSIPFREGNVTFIVRVTGPTGPVNGASLTGYPMPAGARTWGNGSYQYVGHNPAPGTYVIRATREFEPGTTQTGRPMNETEGRGALVVTTQPSVFVQSNLRAPETATVGSRVEVVVNVRNVGNATGSTYAGFVVSGVERAARLVGLGAGESTDVTFAFEPDRVGTFYVETHVQNTTLNRSIEVSPSASFAIGNHNGSALAPTVAPIYARGMQDFGSATIALSMNTSVVSVVNVTEGDMPGAQTTWQFNNSTGYLTILVTTSARPGPSGDFVLAYVWLQATTNVGAETVLHLGLYEATRSDGRAFAATRHDGTFRAGLLGDVTGNGVLDGEDLRWLSEYAVEARPLASLVRANADTNRDGRVSGVDAMFLRQHLEGTRPVL